MDEDTFKLVQRAQKGDKEAYGEIYKLYQKKIYRFSYYMIQNKELAEDITQNTFIKAWRALPFFSLNKNGTIQAYLFKIARNLTIDYQRKRKEVSLEVIEDIMPSDENLEEIVARQEEQEIVARSLKTLDEEERQIVVLRYFEDMSYEEISKVVGKNEGAIRVRLHRTLKKLKEEIKDYGN